LDKQPIQDLVKGYSIETTVRESQRIERYADIVPQGTRLYIAHVPGTSSEDTVLLAGRLRKERSGLKVLFMSGYTDDTLLGHGVYEAREAFLQKPFALQAFASKVRQILDQE